jgi:hypothetical protein
MNRALALTLSRLVNLVAILCGAVVSASLALKVGQSSYSGVLPLVLVVWVLSPFLALLAANRASRYWPDSRRWALLVLVLVVTAESLLVYSGVIAVPNGFLITPLIAWVAIGAVRLMMWRKG